MRNLFAIASLCFCFAGCHNKPAAPVAPNFDGYKDPGGAFGIKLPDGYKAGRREGQTTEFDKQGGDSFSIDVIVGSSVEHELKLRQETADHFHRTVQLTDVPNGKLMVVTSGPDVVTNLYVKGATGALSCQFLGSPAYEPPGLLDACKTLRPL